MTHDAVQHPKHYTSHPSGYECIEIAQHHNFCIGNVIKYVWRAGLKYPDGCAAAAATIEDLKKARKYLDFEIERCRDEAGLGDPEGDAQVDELDRRDALRAALDRHVTAGGAGDLAEAVAEYLGITSEVFATCAPEDLPKPDEAEGYLSTQITLADGSKVWAWLDNPDVYVGVSSAIYDEFALLLQDESCNEWIAYCDDCGGGAFNCLGTEDVYNQIVTWRNSVIAPALPAAPDAPEKPDAPPMPGFGRLTATDHLGRTCKVRRYSAGDRGSPIPPGLECEDLTRPSSPWYLLDSIDSLDDWIAWYGGPGAWRAELGALYPQLDALRKAGL